MGVQPGNLVGLEGRPRDRPTAFPLQGLDAASLLQNLADAGHRDSGFMQVLGKTRAALRTAGNQQTSRADQPQRIEIQQLADQG